jgi:hypothetical protein
VATISLSPAEPTAGSTVTRVGHCRFHKKAKIFSNGLLNAHLIFAGTGLLNLLDVWMIGFNEFCGESGDWVQ